MAHTVALCTFFLRANRSPDAVCPCPVSEFTFSDTISNLAVTTHHNAFGRRANSAPGVHLRSLNEVIVKRAAGKMDLIIPLTSDEIHVWLTSCEAIGEERLLVAYRELLNKKEKEEESRFCFAGDRHRYLVTRALVRTVLSRYAAVDPKDWVFSTNDYGRPQIANTQPTDGCVSFSVSHTHGLIVLGVAKGRSLGVDVENFTMSEVSLDIANHYFAPTEAAALRNVSHDRQQQRFFEYWTLKESYIKARGMGCSLPLDRFSFHFAEDHAVNLEISSELGDDAARWQLWQFRPTSEHLLSVCSEKFNAQSARLVVRETTPTISETVLAPELLRTSEMGN